MKFLPAQITNQKQQLDMLLKAGTTFGALVKFKDVCEVVLRLPVLCAGAFVLANGGDDKDMLTLALVRNRKLSIKNWMDIAHDLSKHGAVPKQLKAILNEVRNFFRKNKIAEWRNTEIAHGALRFDFSREFNRDFQSKVSALEKLLKSLDKQYKSIAVSDDNTTVTANGKTLPLMPYVHSESGEAYLFDSYGNGVAKGLCYALGVKRAIPGEAFVEISKQTRQNYAANNFSESDIEMEMSNIIDELNEAANFQYPMYLRDWLVESMNAGGTGVAKGTMVLKMERGMGKSAFCRALDGRSIDDAYKAFKINDCFTRGYYCSRVGIRSAADFYAGVRSRLLTDENDQMLYSSEEHIPQLSENSTREDFAELLNWCHDRQRGRLLLIIDGIDEIPAAYISVLDKLPTADMLNTGVYILVTCRSQENVPEKKPEEYTKEEKLALDENRQIALALSKVAADREVGYDRTDEKNIAILKAYFENRVFTKKSKRPKNEDLLTLVKEPGKMRFLEVRIIGALWRSEKITDFTKLVKVENLLEYYIRHIREEYGEHVFSSLVDMLVAVACAQEELTLGELAFLLGESGVTVQMLSFASDMAGILSVSRDRRGNHLGLSSAAYRDWIIEQYADKVTAHADALVGLLLDIDIEEVKNLDENGNDHISDGLLYLAANSTHYVNDFASAEIRKCAEQKLLWVKVESFGLAVSGVQDYRLWRQIGCYNSAEVLLGNAADENSFARLRYNRANTYLRLTRYLEALADYNRAIEIRGRLFAAGNLHDENDFVNALMNRANTYHHLVRYTEALADYDKVILMYEKQYAEHRLQEESDIALAYMNRAVTYDAQSRYIEAIDDYDKSVEIFERLFADRKMHDENAIAAARMNRANSYRALSRYDEALTDYDKAIGIRKRLLVKGDLLDESYIAKAYSNRAGTYHYLARYVEALASHDDAIEIIERLFCEGKLHDENYVATVHMNRAVTLICVNDFAGALVDCDRAVEIMERLLSEGKLHDEKTIAFARMNRGITYDDIGEYTKALADYDKVIEIMGRIFLEGGLSDENAIATARMNRANTLCSLARYTEALTDYDKAIETRERLFAENKLRDENDIATARMNRAIAYHLLKRYTEALADYDKAIEIREQMWKSGRLYDERDIGVARMNRAITFALGFEDYDRALEDIECSIEILRKLVREGRRELISELQEVQEKSGTIIALRLANGGFVGSGDMLVHPDLAWMMFNICPDQFSKTSSENDE